MTVWLWSTTAGNNDDSDPGVNFREGMAPSAVNNSTRAVMAAIKKWWLDLGGTVDTAGTSTAFTITSNQVISTLTDGATVWARMHVTNGANPTLAVDGTTAKNITISPAVPPSAGMLLLGTVQKFTYDEGNTEWRVGSFIVPDGVAKTGDIKGKATSVTDAGWVKADGRTIGNASSGAVSRSNADTEALFLQLWADYSNSLLAIQDSSGSASTRGANAAADYAANKRLPLPNLSGRVLAGLDNLSGSSANVVTDSAADTLGSAMGAETHALVSGELAAHTHDAGTLTYDKADSPTGVPVDGTIGISVGGTGGVNSAHRHSLAYTSTAPTGATASAGSGTAHNNMQPTFFGYVFIKL